MDNLRPCPFCGGAPVLENLVIEAVIRCDTCGARIVRRHAARKDTGVPAVKKAWQQRASARQGTGDV